jgi:hypothetical protein
MSENGANGSDNLEWHRVLEEAELPEGRVTTVAAARYGVSESAIGWLAQVFPLIYVVLAIPCGLILDRWFRAGLIAGAVFIVILAYCWIGVVALRDVIPGDTGALARFYDYHSHVHLGVLEQIRLGAVPYLEAQTQYGLGNLLLLYFVTDVINFSNHGFYAGAMLVNVVCVVGFFVVVQQLLGLGWAIAGLVGWVLWPSPDGVLDIAGWAFGP